MRVACSTCYHVSRVTLFWVVSQSEHLVQEAIDNAIVGRTVLVIAHRLSTIQNADQIVVVDDHRIIDVGTHSELLARCARYQDLIKRQSMVGKVPANALESLCD